MNLLKKIALISVLSVTGATANAASMECSIAGSSYKTGSCFKMLWTMNNQSKPANFRITGVNKTISQVLWSGVTSCGTTATSCSVSVRPYQLHTSNATILYTDNSYEQVSANASFETGF